MLLRIDSPLARVFVLAAGVLLSPAAAHARDIGEEPPRPPVPEQPLAPPAPSIAIDTAMESAGGEAGEQRERADRALQIMFRMVREYYDPNITMEALEASVIAGMEKRVADAPGIIAESEAKLAEARAKLAKLEADRAQLGAAAAQADVMTLTDQIISAEDAVEGYKAIVKATEQLRDIAPEDMMAAGVNYMMEQLDPHSQYLGRGNPMAGGGGGAPPMGGIGATVGTDGPYKHLLVHGLRIAATLNEQDPSPARAAGLQRGDVITHIDGRPLAELSLMRALKILRGDAGTKVKLQVERAGAAIPEVTLTREVIALANVSWRIVGGKVGYISLDDFMPADAADNIAKAVKAIQDKLGGPGKVERFILNERNNGGGRLDQAHAILKHFIDGEAYDRSYHAQGVSEDVIRRNTLVSTKGRAGLESVLATEPGDITGGVEMAVIINGGSASASEIVACALQDYGRAIIVGEQEHTFGKGSVQIVRGDYKYTAQLYFCGKGTADSPFGLTPQWTGVPADIVVRGFALPGRWEKSLPHSITPPADARSFAARIPLECEGEGAGDANPDFIDPRTGEFDKALACTYAHWYPDEAAPLRVEVKAGASMPSRAPALRPEG